MFTAVKILFVSDDKFEWEKIKKQLTPSNIFKFDKVTDINNENNDYDFVIIDLELFDLNNIETLCATLQENYYNSNVLMLVGDKCPILGLMNFPILRKPISEYKLLKYLFDYIFEQGL